MRLCEFSFHILPGKFYYHVLFDLLDIMAFNAAASRVHIGTKMFLSLKNQSQVTHFVTSNESPSPITVLFLDGWLFILP